MLHIPLLRKGEPYRSLDVLKVPHHRTRQPFLELSQANAGLIRKDLQNQESARRALARLSVNELLEVCARAAGFFMNESLPLGDELQSPADYVAQLSATTGMPHVLVRKNMLKIRGVLAEMRTVLSGLTRGLDPGILDSGRGEFNGQAVSFYPRTESLGVVLPNNSPGVHALWIPAIAMKTALVLKPGSAEPWTPYRIAQSLIKAGCPSEAFSYYPTDHAGAGEILRLCGRGMMFGDASSIGARAGDPRIEMHGPGYSKVLLGEDCIADWERYLDVMVASILENGGRSCVNASGIWVPAKSREIAEALAERLTAIEPRSAEDEDARLAPFADAGVASRISMAVDQALLEPGATDLTSAHRKTPRLVEWNDCTYLLPTIVHCESPRHPLANREFLFPFASVVEVEQNELIEAMGPTLVVTAITRDESLIGNLISSPTVDRLNIGPIPTIQVAWDQPHEGNLFEHLYGRRAFQQSVSAA